MTEAEVATRLARKGYPASRYRVEAHPWPERGAPPGAFAAVQTWLLVDTSHRRRLDVPERPSRPVLVVAGRVMIGPSPDLWAALMRQTTYFAAPKGFDDVILGSLHRFALDGYDHLAPVEETFERAPDALVVRGHATRGAGRALVTHRFESRLPREGPASMTLLDDGGGFD